MPRGGVAATDFFCEKQATHAACALRRPTEVTAPSESPGQRLGACGDGVFLYHIPTVIKEAGGVKVGPLVGWLPHANGSLDAAVEAIVRVMQ